jgi:hypothetical protein
MRRVTLAIALALGLGAALAACDAASSDPGTGALLQIPGGQFAPGPLPAATGGPATASLVTAHPEVLIGRLHEQLHGVLAPDATAAIVGIAGADGTWILPAGPGDSSAPDLATVTATFGLDPSAEPGPFTLELASVDAAGRIGPPATVDLVADEAPAPDGELVVGLAWTSTADLDLHVVDPTGGEARSGDPNTWQRPPPGNPVDPNAFLTGGILDHDANVDCQLEADPAEHVIWKPRTNNAGMTFQPVIPPGTYTVRVEARAMCGDASAPWYVTVYHEGALVASARGIATLDDVQQPHGKGAGLTALTFTLP